MRHIVWSLITAVVVITSLGSCSLIDDNFDSCDSARNIECRLHINIGIDSLLASQIHGTDGQVLRDALSSYYNSLNSSKRTVNLNFYDATTNGLVASDSVVMQSSEAAYSINLPSGDMNGVAQTNNPLFSGRVFMPDGQSRYSLDLYPADAQVALAAKVDNSITNVQVVVEGCASGFNAIDSTYTYYNKADTLLYTKAASVGPWRTYTGAVLPSNPSQSWTVTVYATTSTGSVTRTVLTVSQPLLPGDIRILQIAIGADGAASTIDLGVGASVTLDWKKGGEYNPEI